jgi:hypothetical protein
MLPYAKTIAMSNAVKIILVLLTTESGNNIIQ